MGAERDDSGVRPQSALPAAAGGRRARRAGSALLIAFGGAVGLAAFRRISAGTDGDGGLLLAVLVALGFSAAIDWTWEIPAVFAPAVASAGLLAASAPGPRLGANAYWLGLGTLAVAWVATIAAALAVLTELKLDQSRDAAAHGRIDEGIERALEARTVQPWSPGALHAARAARGARGALRRRPHPSEAGRGPRLGGLAAGLD